MTHDMHAPNKRRKKRGKLYFSSNKALKTSRMGRRKGTHERYETKGISKILDFENTRENATMSTVDESEVPSPSRGQGSQSQGASKEVETLSTPAHKHTSNTASEEHSGEDELEEVEETSLMEPEGGNQKS